MKKGDFLTWTPFRRCTEKSSEIRKSLKEDTMCNIKNLTVIKDQLRNIIENSLCAVVNNLKIGTKGFCYGHEKF